MASGGDQGTPLPTMVALRLLVHICLFPCPFWLQTRAPANCICQRSAVSVSVGGGWEQPREHFHSQSSRLVMFRQKFVVFFPFYDRF